MYVCKIDKIVINLVLILVRFIEDNYKEILFSIENSFKENKKNLFDWFLEFFFWEYMIKKLLVCVCSLIELIFYYKYIFLLLILCIVKFGDVNFI